MLSFNRDKLPYSASIRGTARLGILSESALRRMAKTGELPCVYSGNRCVVLVHELLAKLERAAAEGGRVHV